MTSSSLIVIAIMQSSFIPGSALRLANKEGCVPAQFLDASFEFCQPPGALGAEFFTTIPENDISIAFVNIVKEDLRFDKHPRVVDVGMNEGWYTLLPASLGAKVMSFEVQPGCMDMVSESVRRNKFDAVLVNQGAFDKAGSIFADAGDCNPGHQMAASQHMSLTKKTKVEVPLVTLDQAIKANKKFLDGPISLLKIDAEGSESNILRGAMELIKGGQVRRLVVEVCPQWWQTMGGDVQAGIQTMKDVVNYGKVKAYVLPVNAEHLGAGLGESVDKYGVAGLREVIDFDTFVADRIAQDRGCNILFF